MKSSDEAANQDVHPVATTLPKLPGLYYSFGKPIPTEELVKLVETTVRSENHRSPNKPIHLVGESLGGCLALAIAARNPDIDLALILANPATSVNKLPLQALKPLLSLMPDKLHYFSLLYMLGLITGDPLRMVFANAEKGLPLQQRVGEILQGLVAPSSHLSVRFSYSRT
ncbi:Acyltransferase-like protein, chloroplastic [Vitis vinifera]|uniref:Acyltransferase-like protein, chloroplastic n=1 Tax=Vitis vinifera TaxID=29760 RepID=A0A438EB80_VITVI|nr:Acyltransferase-like protein, chloroplastic [Vitis vinifera]